MRGRGLAAHLRSKQGRAACVVENISVGGLFVRTDRLHDVGQDLFVDLVRPGWKKQLTLNVRVTSCVDAIDGRLSQRPPGMGLQFSNLDDEQHVRLRSLLRELGAPEAETELTLSDEASELELQALAIDVQRADLEPLDPQPQPGWRKSGPQAGTVEAAIQLALQDADWSPPGPLEDPSAWGALSASPSTAPPFATAAAGPSKPAATAAPGHSARLMLQIRGLIMELSDAQQLVQQRDGEIARLREEVETMRSALARTVRKT